MARKPSRGKLRILCAALLVLAGCQEQEQIRSYDVKKEAFDAAEQDALRMLAVMVPREDTVWFFKLLGAEQAVGEQVPTFDRFLQSVRFRDHDRKPITWTVPEGWRQMPGIVGMLRYAPLGGQGTGPGDHRHPATARARKTRVTTSIVGADNSASARSATRS